MNESRALALRGVIVLSVLTVLPACTWRIVPPPPSVAEDTVYVSLYGRHTRLALPANDDSRYIEYGFGDWRYYALAERSWTSGVRALFSSQRSAMSRREVNLTRYGNPTAAFFSERTEAVTVPEAEVDELRRELERTWSRSEGAVIDRNHHRYKEVAWDYSLANNSNRQTAAWLEALGCDIDGFPLWGAFRVERR